MKPFNFTKSFAAAGLVLGAIGAASTAYARSDVYFSVGVQSPGVYVQPAPVYVQPRPVYVAPQPVYVAPGPIYVEHQPAYPPGHHGQHRYEDDRRRYDSHAWQRRGPYGDHDRDGIANVYDRDSPRNQREWHGESRRHSCSAQRWDPQLRYAPGEVVRRHGGLYVARRASAHVWNVNSPPEWTPNYWAPAHC